MLWDSSVPKFQYPPLRSEDRKFRVIKIQPSKAGSIPSLRERLHIEIIEASVDDVNTFDALSYTWGTGAPDRQVLIDTPQGQRELRITESLEHALRTLSRRSRVLDRPIFVDQICINQDDNHEKGGQVRLMGDIYANCAQVIIWLGKQTRDSSRYFAFTAELCADRGIMRRVMGPNVGHFPQVFNAVMDPTIEVSSDVQRRDRDDLLDLIARHGPRYPVRGVADLLGRPWFNRLWTIQEICLAPAVVLACGDSGLLRLDDFRAGILFYTIWNTHWLRTSGASVSKAEARLRSGIFDLNKSFVRVFQERKAIHLSTTERRSLYDLVLKYNVNDEGVKVGAGMGEDRVYGLLGLARDDEIKGEAVAGMEVGDVASTYTRFASSALRHGLGVLAFSQFPKEFKPKPGYRDLPSWVPDWSTSQLRTPHGYSNLSTPAFSAGGESHGQHITVDISRGTLSIEGIVVDRIARVGTRSIQSDGESSVENADYASVRHFFGEIHEYVQLAAETGGPYAPDTSDDISCTDLAIRLLDGGLTTKQFPATFDTANPQETLRRMYTQVSKYGQRLIDAETGTRAYGSISRIIEAVGIVPWYWVPTSDVDLVRLCATSPITAARNWIEGFICTIIDIIGVCLALVTVQTVAHWIRFRRRFFTKVDFAHAGREATYARIGIDADFMSGEEWELYSSNLLKNAGRKLFVADGGYVGLGPSHMERDDVVVVLLGSTVPLILRPCVESTVEGRAQSEARRSGERVCDAAWWYVGEAYCDGVMEGEALGGSAAESVVNFQIF
ncbi:Uu.00g097870.m01.CDS01 [Anthostomella pinea]|uniref:Uu.00g097870.m01.CDS01 n=1 Tax=Anthostomella pinea TaxID=933095 RepID=A0AAI8VCK3_9PEZI|nr:Uu.00g097870.m01.CDS01 [Anthostomella pinea]